LIAPKATDVGATIWPLEAEVADQLRRLVSGLSVTLHFGGRKSDRYRRLLAQVVASPKDGQPVWVQGRMVASGMARAMPLPGSETCLGELIRLEAAARAARLGLWQSSAYRIRDAARPAELRRLGTTFLIVEGRLASIGGTRGRVYLNFGPDRRRDLSVSLSRREAGRLGIGGSDRASAEGRIVRLRGWLGAGAAPHIEVVSADQIEWIDSLTISAPRRPWRRD
jgi:hypothetical protein